MNGIGMKMRGTRRSWTAARQKVDEQGCRLATTPGHHCTGQVEAAHVIDRSLGGGMQADEIVPLCKAAHSAYDAFELDLLPHLTIDEQVAAVRTLGIEGARRRTCPSDYTPRMAECRRLVG